MDDRITDDRGSVTPMDQAQAQQLGRRIQAVAAQQTGLEATLCDLIDEFDAGGALMWFQGLKSVAHWVGWACSLSPGAAREHVRVARALRAMPHTKALFAEGRLTFSKVRELTRLVGAVDEQGLCRLALEMTASQVARTVRAYRLAPGTRLANPRSTEFRVVDLGDGMSRVTVMLPTEDAALVAAAVESAARRSAATSTVAQGSPSPDRTTAASRAAAAGRLAPESASTDASDDPPSTLLEVPPDDLAAATHLDRVQGLLDIAGCYLDGVKSEPDDDHTLVVVQVSAEQLGALPTVAVTPSAVVPEGTGPTSFIRGAASAAAQQLRAGTCAVQGLGAVEAATAERLLCTGSVLGMVVDRHGDVLAQGRTRRLATRAQKRAVRVRDHGICQFPGCSQVRHLDVHHLVPWLRGGRTDLDNLILLCRRHHVLVHEGGLRIVRLPRGRDEGVRIEEGELPPHRDGERGPSNGSARHGHRGRSHHSRRRRDRDRPMPEPSGTTRRFDFVLPTGESLTGSWRASLSAERLAGWLRTAARMRQDDARPDRVFPPHSGAGFELHECVRVLFDLELPAAA